jgi:hypothetical protein
MESTPLQDQKSPRGFLINLSTNRHTTGKAMNQLEQRKRTPRAFHGLVGRYEAGEATPATPATPAAPAQNVKPGPGRPRLHASNAEKQRAYRNRRADHRADPEARSLIAWILKKSWTVRYPRGYRRKLHAELLALPVSDLRKSVRVLKANLDEHGRLHGERSGESGERIRDDGVSEIEHLLALRELNDRRVSPESPSILQAPPNDEMRDAAIRDLVNEMSVDGKCLWCDAKFEVRTAAENHLNEQYDVGKRQADHVKTLRGYELIPIDLLEEAEGRLLKETHYRGISDRVRSVRKRHTRWQREGKKILDDSKSFVEFDLRVW